MGTKLTVYRVKVRFPADGDGRKQETIELWSHPRRGTCFLHDGRNWELLGALKDGTFVAKAVR